MNAPLRLEHVSAEILLGMPHLALNGLSETWLLKDLGHRHWLMLARLAGRAAPDFKDPRGGPVYAAFRSAEISGARFGRARENDILHIASSVTRISRTQTLSRHTLAIDGEPIGEVTLTSVFVHRSEGPSNHAIARVEIPGLPAFQPRLGQILVAPMPRSQLPEPHDLCEFTPCPSLDFNGAGFLYFTSFLGFVERAEWAVVPDIARRGQLRHRRIDYFGNIDPGESIAVALAVPEIRGDIIIQNCWVERSNDRAILASFYTEKHL